MRALGAIGLIVGVSWLDRKALVEGIVRILNRKREPLSDKAAHGSRLLKRLASLPAWPGAAMIIIGGIIIWM